ncbi:hypothetical protein SDC9_130396 [bioreactor metagenome]|uniref:Uncharacterized protein n=1 Tax=bioreactor metagenome TaxID=1076179 RepID=A0A645D3N7_9ZZZZ
MSLEHGYRLTARVDDEDGVGNVLHVFDAGEVLLKLIALFAELNDLFFRVLVDAAVLFHLLELRHAHDAAADRRKVGEEASEPALVDIELTGLERLVADRVLRLAFGSHKENAPARLRDFADKIIGLFKPLDSLLKVDDIDPIALREDERLHLRVPASRLVSEMDAAFKKLFHAYYSHVNPSCFFPPDVSPAPGPGLREHLLRQRLCVLYTAP